MSSETEVIEGTDLTVDEWSAIEDWLADKEVDLSITVLTAMDLANLLEMAAGAGIISTDEHPGMNDLYGQLLEAVIGYKAEWESISA